MRILITGSSGFIGKHFVRKLIDDNHIRAIDIRYPENMKFMEHKNFYFTGYDCRDLFESNDTEQFDLVIHCAAIVGGRHKIENDPIAVATDLSIDAEMFNWAVRTKQPRVVYFSSSAAYPIEYQDGRGRLNESDIDLTNIQNPDMTYGWAKLTGEMLAEYARKQGVNVHVFRPFSGYGEDQDLDYPFPTFIDQAKKIKNGELDHFKIWSNTTRDFIHVDDIVEAVMKSVELDIQETINLGSGIGTSFSELAQMILNIIRKDVPITTLSNMPKGVQYRVSDNSKMLSFYQPKISLEEGIKRALYEK